jgi:rod shape-determining protein MreD
VIPTSTWRFIITSAVCLYIAAAAQQSLARWTILGGRFDFMLVVLAVLCLFTNRRGGAILGFFDAWIYASIDGANMWQYVLTRTLGGFLISWVAEGGIEHSYFAAALSGFVAVPLCQMILLFLAPPPQIAAFLGDTIRTAVYNGVLAMPIYAAANRILGPRR